MTTFSTFILLASFFINFQGINCRLLTKDINYNKPIKVEIQNASNQIIWTSISLEKKLGNEWILYTSDATAKPFTKGVLTGIHKGRTSLFSFLIPLPELFIVGKSGRYTPVKDNLSKTGIFRVKVSYGFTADEMFNYYISPEFNITVPPKGNVTQKKKTRIHN